jgi:hypothetical protein
MFKSQNYSSWALSPYFLRKMHSHHNAGQCWAGNHNLRCNYHILRLCLSPTDNPLQHHENRRLEARVSLCTLLNLTILRRASYNSIFPSTEVILYKESIRFVSRGYVRSQTENSVICFTKHVPVQLMSRASDLFFFSSPHRTHTVRSLPINLTQALQSPH